VPLSRLFGRVVARTRSQPRIVHYVGAAALAGFAFGARVALDPLFGDRYVLTFAGPAVLLSSTLFGGGGGMLAMVLSAGAGAWVYMAPVGSFRVDSPAEVAGLVAFCGQGALIALVVETLHSTTGRLQGALVRLEALQHHRLLLLREFRHRARNDLQSLSAMLLLRARGATPEAATALREASGHALAMSKVHKRLETIDADDVHGAFVDTADFVAGLCHDFDRTLSDGLRPVAIKVDAESHQFDTERSISLGLVLHETLTNALKYAFPNERHGEVCVIFRAEAGHFLLLVEDDGIGMPPSNEAEGRTIGSRLLRGLAAQLRGVFRREPRPEGGTRCELRFPFDAPSLRPESIGSGV
jgi:two-component sensor histidine kinase